MKNRARQAMRGGNRGAVSKGLLFVTAAVLVAAGACFGLSRYHDVSAANAEAEAQKPEIDECRKRLASFYAAWKRFTADHKGAQPHSYADLVPKYIPDPKLLTCPTAARWIRNGASIDSGSIAVNKESYRVTYGFIAFAASYPMQVKRFGDRTVMAVCNAHQEGMYRAVYHRAPTMGGMESTQHSGAFDVTRDAKQLVLRKNGVVDFQTETQ